MTGRRGPIARAVGEALRAAQVPARDRAAVAVAKRYAALIDEAAPAAVYQKPLRDLRAAVAGTDAEEALLKVETALAEHSVASDLGPKLLAALTALGMTAAGRGVKGGGGVPVVDDELARLRERAQRRRGAG